MYKSTPITQKCKSSPARIYTPPGVNQDLISGAGTSSDKFNDNVAVTDEDKEKQNAKEVAKAENTASRQRNPAQQARYEGRKERQSIRQNARAERIKAKNIGRAKSVQERVDNKNKYLNTSNISNTSTNIDQPVVDPRTGKMSHGYDSEFEINEGK